LWQDRKTPCRGKGVAAEGGENWCSDRPFGEERKEKKNLS